MSNDDRTKGSGEESGKVNRRDFLRGAAATSVAAGLLGDAGRSESHEIPADTDAEVSVVGPEPVKMRFKINGEMHEAMLEPRVTLLDALRSTLDMTGAKRVCDRATCGACTVLLNGKAVYACSVLAIEARAERHEITTVEGLAEDGTPHPLQQAFVDNDALQCGFCTPGFVAASKALLDENPDPSEDEIHKGLSGNFCRCGTYMGIRDAVRQTADQMKEG